MVSDSVNRTHPFGETATYTESVISQWLWRVVSPVIFSVGISGNILVLGVLKRLHFTSSSTLVHLFLLALADSGVLVSGLLRFWIQYTFEVDIRLVSDIGCKLHSYFTYTIIDFSSWILVSVTLERIICVLFPLHVKAWCTVPRACWRLLLTFVVLSTLNSHFFWSYGLKENDGEMECKLVVERMEFYDRFIFVWLDLCVASLGPFIIMFICNILIIRTLARHHFNRKWRNFNASRVSKVDSSNRNTATTRLLLTVTTFYGCSMLPASVLYIVEAFVQRDSDELLHAKFELAWTLTYLLQFSNYAVNVILYTARNRKFRREVLRVFHLGKPRQTAATVTTILSSVSLQESLKNRDHSASERSRREIVEEPLEDNSSDCDSPARNVIHVTKIMESENVNTVSARRRQNSLNRIKGLDPHTLVVNDLCGEAFIYACEGDSNNISYVNTSSCYRENNTADGTVVSFDEGSELHLVDRSDLKRLTSCEMSGNPIPQARKTLLKDCEHSHVDYLAHYKENLIVTYL